MRTIKFSAFAPRLTLLALVPLAIFAPGHRVSASSRISADSASLALVVLLSMSWTGVPAQEAVENVYPRPSPDGRLVAFMSNGDIHVIDLSTRQRSVVVATPLPEANPDWSPDGTRLVYTTGSADARREVWIVSLSDGRREPINLAPGAYSRPVWSPKGDAIAFVASRPPGTQLQLLELSTGRVTALTAEGVRDARPAWSPDGTRIAFDRTHDGNTDIFILDLGSGQIDRLTTSPSVDANPTWSPRGDALAFNSSRSGGGDLYTQSFA